MFMRDTEDPIIIESGIIEISMAKTMLILLVINIEKFLTL